MGISPGYADVLRRKVFRPSGKSPCSQSFQLGNKRGEMWQWDLSFSSGGLQSFQHKLCGLSKCKARKKHLLTVCRRKPFLTVTGSQQSSIQNKFQNTQFRKRYPLHKGKETRARRNLKFPFPLKFCKSKWSWCSLQPSLQTGSLNQTLTSSIAKITAPLLVFEKLSLKIRAKRKTIMWSLNHSKFCRRKHEPITLQPLIKQDKSCLAAYISWVRR